MFILFDAALRGMLLSLLLLLSALLWRERRHAVLAQLGVALCLGLCVQVLSSTPLFEVHVPRLWQAPLIAISVGNAVLFLLLVQALFDDEFRLRRSHGLLWAGVIMLSAVHCVAQSWPTLLAVRLVPLICALLAAFAAARQWRADLIEQRRTLRAVIAAGGIFYTAMTLALRLRQGAQPWQGAAPLLDILLLLLVVAIAACHMVSLARTELLPARAPVVQARTVPDDALATALARLMRDELAYRDGALTVAALAARLAVPEYRLRRLINRQLGHRNFNSYINELRLREVQAALVDPRQRALPVLTIALTAGFQSVGPFNRAFKAATGLTPTEFRKQNMADS